MEPTLSDGDVVLAVPGAWVRPGRVALVVWTARPGQLSVKRLGPSADGGRSWDARGDNPAGSTDSRALGPAMAVGPVLWRLWPHPGPVRIRVR